MIARLITEVMKDLAGRNLLLTVTSLKTQQFTGSSVSHAAEMIDGLRDEPRSRVRSAHRGPSSLSRLIVRDGGSELPTA
jgi:hypothetical protein